MRIKTKAAQVMRRVGLENLVDSPVFRKATGAPLYAKHKQEVGSIVKTNEVNEESATSEKTVESNKPTVSGFKTYEAFENPKLSVIVPVYNVENFVNETLKSINNQSIAELEIIVVNDGSTDGSLQVVEKAASVDKRIRIISQPNAGLGAARNTGIRAAKAPYLAFVDSDDIIPQKAFELLYQSLEKTGSDVSIGALRRFNSAKSWIPAWAQMVHAQERIAIRADEFPQVLWNVFACGKVFKSSTFREIVKSFPEGILYEDQEVTGALFTNSEVKIDILAEVVYDWRLRDDASSITQQKGDFKDLTDRMGVLTRMHEILKASGNKSLLDYWYFKTFDDDLYWYYLAAPRCEQDFTDYLRSCVEPVFSSCPIHVLQQIRPERRWITLALINGTHKDFINSVIFAQEHPQAVLIEKIRGDKLSVRCPFENDISFDIKDDERIYANYCPSSKAAITSYKKLNNGKLEIEGYCYFWGFGNEIRPSAARARIEKVSDTSGEQSANEETQMVYLPVDIINNPEANIKSLDHFTDYSGCGFRIEIDAAQVLGKLEESFDLEIINQDFTLAIEYRYNDSLVFVNREVSRLTTGKANKVFPIFDANSGIQLVPITVVGQGFGFKVLNSNFVLTDYELADNEVYLKFFSESHSTVIEKVMIPRELYLSSVDSNELRPKYVDVENLGNGYYSATVNFGSDKLYTKKNLSLFNVSIKCENGASSYLIASDLINDYRWGLKSNILLQTSGFGVLQIGRANQYGYVESVEILAEDYLLRVKGRYYLSSSLLRVNTPCFALVGSEDVIYPVEVNSSSIDSSFSALFDLSDKDGYGNKVAIKTGTYYFQMLTQGEKGLPKSCWLPVAYGLGKTFNSGDPSTDICNSVSRIQVTTTPTDGAIAVDLRAAYNLFERSKFGQTSLQMKYFGNSAYDRSIEPAVLFESFGGVSIQDSPKAIDRYIAKNFPEIKRLWVVADGSVSVPEGAIPVVRFSEAYYKYLATAKLLVNNNNFPACFRKHPEQVYIQTWHGTPLKKIGNDVPSVNLSLSYREIIKREAEQYWDYLIAQSEWAKPILANAFGFSGETIGVGYPRNDALNSKERNDIRNRIRRYYGIDNSQFVILYAPTWRDNKKESSGHYKREIYLDTDKMIKEFGDKLVIIVRGHSNTLNSNTRASGQNVFDVSRYQDINDLYLAADLLITDYSSVMFDYVVTGKPIIYLVPDLAEYRDKTRGFYFDFENFAPGSLCESNEKVLAIVKDLLVRGRGIEGINYLPFVKKFASLDDGKATERFMERLIPLITEMSSK